MGENRTPSNALTKKGKRLFSTVLKIKCPSERQRMSSNIRHSIAIAWQLFDIIEEALKGVRDDAAILLAKSYNNDNGRQREEHMAMQRISDEQIEVDFIQPQRYLYIVHIHIILETQLQKICEELCGEFNNKNGTSITLRDINGSQLDKLYTFITKLAAHEIPVQWASLRDLQSVRNCIIHCNGTVSEDKLRKYNEIISRTDGLSIKYGDLFIEDRYCLYCRTQLHKFFNDLLKTLGW